MWYCIGFRQPAHPQHRYTLIDEGKWERLAGPHHDRGPALRALRDAIELELEYPNKAAAYFTQFRIVNGADLPFYGLPLPGKWDNRPTYRKEGVK
jgi:hypothetical protein